MPSGATTGTHPGLITVQPYITSPLHDYYQRMQHRFQIDDAGYLPALRGSGIDTHLLSLLAPACRAIHNGPLATLSIVKYTSRLEPPICTLTPTIVKYDITGAALGNRSISATSRVHHNSGASPMHYCPDVPTLQWSRRLRLRYGKGGIADIRLDATLGLKHRRRIPLIIGCW